MFMSNRRVSDEEVLGRFVLAILALIVLFPPALWIIVKWWGYWL